MGVHTLPSLAVGFDWVTTNLVPYLNVAKEA